MFTERDMQYILRDNPQHFFGDTILLYQREVWLGTDSRIDFIFIDTAKKEHILVECQIGQLDKLHIEKMWNRYIKNYKIMRPDVKIRSILIANSATKKQIELNRERDIEVHCYSVEELLNVDKKYTRHDQRPEYPEFIGRFTGLTDDDFDGIIEADKNHNADYRISSIGKLYQIRDYLIPKIEKDHPDVFVDTKVSDKVYKQRLGVPWMGFYFDFLTGKGKNLPHINLTLAEESENGLFKKNECSLHLNAEIKPNFEAVLKALKNRTIDMEIDKIRNRGLQLRYYSKIQLGLPNTNNNVWNLRKTWEINTDFNSADVIEWFEQFKSNDAIHIREDIERMVSIPIFSEEDAEFMRRRYKFDGFENNRYNLSTEGRSVFRLGRWWSVQEVVNRKDKFADDIYEATSSVSALFKYFYVK